MSLTGAAIDLASALKTARASWEDARAEWNDSVSRDFEEHQWDPLETHIRAVIDALDRLSPILSRALHDCS